jgi:hypothetical protein
MLRVGQQLPLLGVRGLGQLCGMRVLGGPLGVLWGGVDSRRFPEGRGLVAGRRHKPES